MFCETRRCSTEHRCRKNPTLEVADATTACPRKPPSPQHPPHAPVGKAHQRRPSFAGCTVAGGPPCQAWRVPPPPGGAHKVRGNRGSPPIPRENTHDPAAQTQTSPMTTAWARTGASEDVFRPENVKGSKIAHEGGLWFPPPRGLIQKSTVPRDRKACGVKAACPGMPAR